MELWTQIEGFNYEVSSWGRIRNLKGEILKPYKTEKGYLKIELQKNGEGHKKRIHRLVAKAFIDNPLDLPQVNHKDGNKENNSVTNLEWITDRGNKEHAARLRRLCNK